MRSSRCAAPSTWRRNCRTARCASTSWASAAPTMTRCRTSARSRRWRASPRRRCAPAPWASPRRAPPSTRPSDGRFTPSLSAREAELLGIATGMKRAGRGVLQVNSDFGPGEFEALQAAAALAGRPLSCLLVQVDAEPRLWRETLDQIHGVRQAGPRRQRAGRLAADRRHHGAGDHRPSLRRPSGLARDAQALARRALRPTRRRSRAAPPPGRDAGRWRLARLHGPVVPQDVPGGRAARLRARCRELGRRHRPTQRPHAAGGGARRDDGARTARAC